MAMIARTFIAVATLLTASTVNAAAPAQQPAPERAASADAAADAEAAKKVCRTEKATGSLTRRTRICLTAAQWREIQDRTRRGVDEMTSVASGGKECILDAAGGCR